MFRPLAALVLCALSISACHGKTGAGTTAASTTGKPGEGTTSSGDGGTTTGGGTTGTPLVPVEGLGPDVQANCVTAGTVDVNVSVTTKLGPVQVTAGGSSTHAPAPLTISNNAYSQGIMDLARSDYDPKWEGYDADRGAKYDAFLKGLKPGMLRFPAGYRGQQFLWSRTATDSASTCCYDSSTLTPAWLDAVTALCQRVGAQPYIAVNMESTQASASMAADMVRYLNVEKKAGVTWWQLGNEPDLPSKSVWTPASYAAKLTSYAGAMRAVDPTIKFVGGVFYNGIDTTGKPDGSEPDWLTPMLEGLKASGGSLDAFAWHYYPLYSGETVGSPKTGNSSSLTVANIMQEDVSDWPPAGLDFADMVMPGIAKRAAAYAAQMGSAQVWIDEIAEDSGNSLAGKGVSDVVAGAVWAADMLGRYLDYGVGAMFKFIYTAPAEYAYTMLDANMAPRPEYYTNWLYAQHFGDRMVAADIDKRSKVGAHAALRAEDGSLRLVLVNKQSTPQAVRVKLTDYAPRAAGSFLLQGDGASSATATVNGQTLTMANIGQANAAIPAANAQACADTIVTLPAYSVQLLVYSSR